MYQFNRLNFFPLKKKICCSRINKILSLNLINEKVLKKFSINNVSSPKNLKKNSILFLNKENINFNLSEVNNCNIITDKFEIFNNPKFESKHLVKDIDRAYNDILNFLFYHEDSINFNDDFINRNNSFISKYAKIHNSSLIYKNCIIGRGVQIGKNCIIKNNVVIKNSIIGDNVIIGDNSTIGSTGFGFNLNKMGVSNLAPHVGIVIIEDNVLIGSNCSIDRGKLDYTLIGENSMLDNLIHIGHNVILNKNVCIAAQTGIAGSAEIGNNVIIGGQVGIAGHIKIHDSVIIAAKSGVTKNITKKSIVAGFPAVDIKEWKKSIINLKKYGHK